MSKTNETTAEIRKFCFEQGIFIYRSNSVGIFDPTAGRFRTAAKTGVPDLTGVLPGGRAIYIEIKTGKDRLRPEQIGFLKTVKALGGIALEVKTFEDFQAQFETEVKPFIKAGYEYAREIN